MVFDVAVIGAGPAGSAAAMRCAMEGLDTVVLEKKRLPRDKVCSGMIIGPLAHSLIKEAFGELPEAVLCRPPQLKGYRFHLPDVDNSVSLKLDFSIPLTWRRNLDFWMAEKAKAKGAQIREGAKVTRVIEKARVFSIKFECDGERQEIEARFVIGADGGTSMVRKNLFPYLKVPFNQAYEEWHEGSLKLDAGYFHWFYLQKDFPGGFAVHQKDSLIVLEFGGTAVVPQEGIKWARDYLTKNHGLDQSQEPLSKGACAVARLAGGLASGDFMPAEKNVLLVGEAGGFVIPITNEGIGTGLKSGVLAAESIIQALKSNCQADKIYLNEIKPITAAFREYSLWLAKVEEAAKTGGNRLLETLAAAHEASLRMF